MTSKKKHTSGNKTEFDFELFFDKSPDLLCIAGFDGYFKRINPAVSALLGYSNEELFSKPINEFIHEEDRHLTSAVRAELVKRKPLLNFENRYITKSGDIVWLSWTSMPIEGNEVIFAIAKNITHKKKLEHDRNQILTGIHKMNEELKHLTFATSHDMRSPVNNLVSILDLINVSKIEDEETLKFIGFLKSASESLKMTLNGFVDLLLEKNGMNTTIDEVKFSAVLNVVMDSISELIKSSRTIIEYDFSAFEMIKFNRINLASIFLNLITNSIKYKRPEAAPVISVSSNVKSGVQQLIFTDNGLGFDLEKVKDKIFGFNQTFHSHSDSKGIGLYLVHHHVTSSGGKINVESKVNEGTTFTISFAN